MHRRLALVMATAAALAASLLQPGTAVADGTPVTKVLVVVEENHSLDEMLAQMPFTASLAQQYGYATGYRAIRHPSLPDYLAISGGSTFGVTDDKPPSAHPIPYTSVLGQAVAAGRTAKTYAESMPAPCTRTDAGLYAVRHNPWTYFSTTAERARCARYDVPFTAFAPDVAAGQLPTVGLVVPNLCDDAHNCPLATADAWFQQLVQTVFAGPDWQSGHLAVVLTADESESTDPTNTVLTLVIHPSQQGHVVTTALSHYSLTRLCQDVAHTAHLRRAATAPSLSAAFGLPIG